LAGAYSERDTNLELDGNPEAMTELSEILRIPGDQIVPLISWRRLRQEFHAASELRIFVDSLSRARISILREGNQFALSGGLEAAALLANSLAGLSRSPLIHQGGVPAHLDLEPFDGDEMLEPTGFGMTIVLVEDPGVGPAL
jgi:hypothetical protein